MTKHIAIFAVVLGAAAGCNENAAHQRMSETRRMTADLITHFARSADASDRAVMADTDEASARFAAEAQAATKAVEANVTALAQLFKSLNYSDEAKALQAFDQQFSAYRDLNNSILALAVEGTNLKAQRLSFGAVQKEADAFRDALDGLVPATGADTWRIKALSATALAGAREIQVLQAPHIAEPDDNAMARLEARMTNAETTVRTALAMLRDLVAASSQPKVAAATAAMDQLSLLNLEIQRLSRRNTNVRSLALSLGQKRARTEACETALRTLQDEVWKRGLPTR